MQCYVSLTVKVCLESEICCTVIIQNPLPHSYLKDTEIGTRLSLRNILRFYRMHGNCSNMSPYLLITGYLVSRNLVQFSN